MDDIGFPYVVRPMALADVPEVAELEKQVFSLPWSWHAFEHELQHNPMARFLVLRRCPGKPAVDRDSPLLGYGGFWLIVDEAHICTLAVHPEWRGRGLGELLLVRLIDLASQVEATFVTLEVRVSNATAQQLYAKYGFAHVGRRKGYYSDTGEDALIMTTDGISTASFQGRFQELKAALTQKLVTRERQPAGTVP